MAASSIADIRRDYKLQSLDENDIAADPITQFTRWWEEAIASHIDEVNAMTLATVTPEGLPAARIVLLKGYDEQGFVFFTNYQVYQQNQMCCYCRRAQCYWWIGRCYCTGSCQTPACSY